MALRVRTSINLGPMRFNLSQSGVGVSVGVKGFRVGTGPRGNYVRMSAMGVRMSFTESPALNSGHATRIEEVRTEQGSFISSDGVVMNEIESASVCAMVDSNASQLLAEITEKRRRTSWAPIAVCASIVFLLVLATAANGIVLLGFALVAALLCQQVHKLDRFKKATVIFYDLTPEVQLTYERLHQWFEALCLRDRVWHISASGQVRDRKYHGGASSLINRHRIKPGVNLIPTLHTNIDIPMIPVGRQILAFMPETLLVFENNAVGAVSYQDLRIEASTTNMIEHEIVPRDARQVGTTWAKVNRDGGPDRRFKDNRQLPIMEYEEIDFKSTSGLNECIQLSSPGVGDSFKQCFRALSPFTRPERAKQIQ